MTSIYFVRHAQPDEKCKDDRTKPLTPLGINDRQEVTKLFSDIQVDKFISSPYKRSYDTIADCANTKGMIISTDERLRERDQGISSIKFLEKRWDDFDFCEEGGETIRSLQQRNIEALKEILQEYNGMNIVIGTHGAALSSIMNYFDSSFGCNWFKKIWFCMPYVIRLDFNNWDLIGSEELLSLERGYTNFGPFQIRVEK